MFEGTTAPSPHWSGRAVRHRLCVASGSPSAALARLGVNCPPPHPPRTDSGGHSPVRAADSVPAAGGEEGLVHALHEGLGHGALGNPNGTHPAAGRGAGGESAGALGAGPSQLWDPKNLGRGLRGGLTQACTRAPCRPPPAPGPTAAAAPGSPPWPAPAGGTAFSSGWPVAQGTALSPVQTPRHPSSSPKPLTATHSPPGPTGDGWSRTEPAPSLAAGGT